MIVNRAKTFSTAWVLLVGGILMTSHAQNLEVVGTLGADNLTIDGSVGVGKGIDSQFRLDALGAARADEFRIDGEHQGGSKTFLRQAVDSEGVIYGFEVRNFEGGYFQSDRTQIVIFAGDPTDSVGKTHIMDGSTSGSDREMLLGSYHYSGADVVLFPGEIKALVAKPSGKVGIGTSDPEADFEVQGTVKFARQGDILMGQFGNPE